MVGTNSPDCCIDSFSIQIMKVKRRNYAEIGELDGSQCALSNLGKLPSSSSSHVEACCYRLCVRWESLFDFFIWLFFCVERTCRYTEHDTRSWLLLQLLVKRSYSWNVFVFRVATIASTGTFWILQAWKWKSLIHDRPILVQSSLKACGKRF